MALVAVVRLLLFGPAVARVDKEFFLKVRCLADCFRQRCFDFLKADFFNTLISKGLFDFQSSCDEFFVLAKRAA